MIGEHEQRLYVVEVNDRCLEPLAGHNGCSYASPPQPRAQAIALVQALLGCPFAQMNCNARSWHRAIAGGRRTIHLHAAGLKPGPVGLDTTTEQGSAA